MPLNDMTGKSRVRRLRVDAVEKLVKISVGPLARVARLTGFAPLLASRACFGPPFRLLGPQWASLA